MCVCTVLWESKPYLATLVPRWLESVSSIHPFLLHNMHRIKIYLGNGLIYITLHYVHHRSIAEASEAPICMHEPICVLGYGARKKPEHA